ncbi:MAG: IS1634 family transposase [bacterium]|jgi:Transposase DDE domain
MFIKVIFKKTDAVGGYTTQYRLCESYRTGNTVKHETLLHLGSLSNLKTVEQKKALGIRINELVKQARTGIRSLFIPDAKVEALAQSFFLQLQEKKGVVNPAKDIQRIDMDNVRLEDFRELGTEWLCHQALGQLGVADLLEKEGWGEEQINLAVTHIISRAAYPASELCTSRWIKDNSAVCELTGYPATKVTKDKLYGISLDLYKVKDTLEKHLSKRTNTLFDLKDQIILYDLTNTYFEGSMRSSKIAKFGRSKEKRSDARLVVLAVVVNTEGFLKYSQIFEGNIADCATLSKIIEDLSERTSSSKRKPTVVLDAGIATEDNLILLKEKGFDYMCVSRSGLKNYTVDSTSTPVTVKDNKGQLITLRKVVVEGSTDNWLQVHSPAKELKETSMSNSSVQRFEQGLEQVKLGIAKKSGTKKQEKVWERIGRLKERYPSIQQQYKITTDTDEKGIVTAVNWERKTVENKDGYYLLRTSLDEKDEAVQWEIYNTIREIEATFRILKTDLDLRPIYHKNDDAAMAHLHLGLLAYWVVNTIRYQLKQKGINHQWKEIVRTMNTQKMGTVKMENEDDQEIIIRRCTEPIAIVKEIYTALKYKERPFCQRKFVVPLTKTENHVNPVNTHFYSG